jgi:D-3-phosphoglycerate dehydrogenase
MPKPRVLIFNEGYGWEDLCDLSHSHLDVTCVPGGTRKQLLELIADFDVYVPCLRIVVDKEVLDRAQRLKVIASQATGTDHLDLKLIEQRGITLFTLKHDRELLDNITTTAELAWGLLMCCARKLPECFDASRQGYWGRHQFAGIQLNGKTLGIVGVGRLGTMMCQYGKAFRMRVLGYDPHQKQLPPGIEMVSSLDKLLAQSDFVTLHVHLTEQTRNLIGARELTQMKRGASIINTSRGGLIDEAALIREMDSGRIAAAGLDLIDGEWLEDKYNHPLIAYSRRNPRLYITPHVGGTSPDAVRMTARHNFQKVIRHFQEHPVG